MISEVGMLYLCREDKLRLAFQLLVKPRSKPPLLAQRASLPPCAVQLHVLQVSLSQAIYSYRRLCQQQQVDRKMRMQTSYNQEPAPRFYRRLS